MNSIQIKDTDSYERISSLKMESLQRRLNSAVSVARSLASQVNFEKNSLKHQVTNRSLATYLAQSDQQLIASPFFKLLNDKAQLRRRKIHKTEANLIKLEQKLADKSPEIEQIKAQRVLLGQHQNAVKKLRRERGEAADLDTTLEWLSIKVQKQESKSEHSEVTSRSGNMLYQIEPELAVQPAISDQKIQMQAVVDTSSFRNLSPELVPTGVPTSNCTSSASQAVWDSAASQVYQLPLLHSRYGDQHRLSALVPTIDAGQYIFVSAVGRNLGGGTTVEVRPVNSTKNMSDLNHRSSDDQSQSKGRELATFQDHSLAERTCSRIRSVLKRQGVEVKGETSNRSYKSMMDLTERSGLSIFMPIAVKEDR